MTIIKKIDAVLASIAKLLCFLGALILVAMFSITTVDVFLRTFMGSSVVGASVMVRNLLIASVFLGLPYVTFTCGHTRSEVFYVRAGKTGKMVLDLIANVVGVAMFTAMSYSMVSPVFKAYSSGEFDSEGTMLMLLWPFYLVALFGASFSLYASIRNLVVQIAGIVSDKKGSVSE